MVFMNSPHLLAGPGGVSYKVKTPVKIVALIIIKIIMV